MQSGNPNLTTQSEEIMEFYAIVAQYEHILNDYKILEGGVQKTYILWSLNRVFANLIITSKKSSRLDLRHRHQLPKDTLYSVFLTQILPLALKILSSYPIIKIDILVQLSEEAKSSSAAISIKSNCTLQFYLGICSSIMLSQYPCFQSRTI